MPLFYDCQPTPNGKRARVFLAEKGIEVEIREIDIFQGQQLTDEYKAINPSCTVPAMLLDDGTALTDNVGIAVWAEAAQPEPPLLGTTAIEKAQILTWNAYTEAEGMTGMAEVFRNTSPLMVDRALTGPNNFKQMPELVDRGMIRATTYLDRLDKQIGDGDYVVGDRFSMADISAYMACEFANVLKMNPDSGRPNLARWRAAISKRPSMSL